MTQPLSLPLEPRNQGAFAWGLIPVLMIVFALLAGPAAQAQNGPLPASPSGLLERLAAEREMLSAENAARIEAFEAARDEQAARLEALEAELAAAREESVRLLTRFEAAQASIAEAEGSFTEAFSPYGGVAGRFAEQLGRLEAKSQALLGAPLAELDAIARPDPVLPLPPTERDLALFGRAALALMSEQGFAGRQAWSVISPNGALEDRPLQSAATFLRTDGGRLYRPGPGFGTGEGGLLGVDGVEARFEAASRDFVTGRSVEGLVPAPLDLSGAGQVLEGYRDRPSLFERLAQGRFVGLLILALLIAGLVIAVERLIRLELWRRRMDQVLAGKAGIGPNPYSAVLSTYQETRQKRRKLTTELLERRLEETIARQLPALERRVSVLRVMAALATLLGLLGTVIGMIRTFDVFAVAGSGEPGLMAAGISEALVTTMLGLIVAIPLIVLHGVVQSRSRELVTMLEQEALGLVAKRLEEDRG